MKKFIITLTCLLFVLACKTDCMAYEYGSNPDTGYIAVIFDDGDYLSSSEESMLLKKMMEVTEYSNVVYLTSNNNYYCTESYSESIGLEAINSIVNGNEPGICYVCDNEYDYIVSVGTARKRLTSSKCSSIADNIYKLSADERYYDAAVKAFNQIYTLYKGYDIPQPMLYICTAFFGLFVSLLFCFVYASSKSSVKKATELETVMGSFRNVQASGFNIELTNTTRVYSPASSGGGGHGGHGGGHGGGHSGGGHSH